MGSLLLLGDPQQVFPGVLTSLRGFFGVRVCGQCWSVGQCLLGRGVLTQFWGSNHPVLVLVAVSFPKETNPLVGIPTHPGLAFLRFWICPEKKFPVEGKVPFPLFFCLGVSRITVIYQFFRCRLTGNKSNITQGVVKSH